MSPRTRFLRGPPPPPPALPTPAPPPGLVLAVNTERTSSVSWEIFISGRVGSVCWPPCVLPAGWPGAGGEGAWQPPMGGSLCGLKSGPGRECPRLLLEPESEAWSGGRGKGGRETCFLQVLQHNLPVSHVLVFISRRAAASQFLRANICSCLGLPPGLPFLLCPRIC